MGCTLTPKETGPTTCRDRLRPRWINLSIRSKLLAMALLPLLVVLPLLLGALVLWGNAAYDSVLITKVRSDLSVARGYFDQVLGDVGSGSHAVATSHTLHLALAKNDMGSLQTLLAQARGRLGVDFINLYSPQGQLLTADWANPDQPLPTVTRVDQLGTGRASLTLMPAPDLLALAPHLSPRIHIPLIDTHSAMPTSRSMEDRALVMLATTPVLGMKGETLALLRTGVLLNQNLPLIDHINRIVYPQGALPLGSHGTATLFMDDVRITTNVRLFQDQRAIGTRVSKAVHAAVLTRGETWLDRAFVVNDWYVSAYEPLLDGAGQRVGMLYVGFLEAPFRQVKIVALAVIVGIFMGVMVLAALFSVRWARSIFKPVEQMNRAMQRVEEGDASARVGPVQARDEIGALAHHLDQLLNVVDAKVTERTQALAQSTDALQKTQQQLVKSEKLAAIGQLTASVAHEINNPIAVMQGNLDLMRELLGEHARPVATELQLLDQQVERMRLIVTQLLQYSRPTDYAGYVVPVDVNHTLNNALVLVAHLLTSTRIQVQRDLQASTLVCFNAQELQQVVINLLINAIQAMPDGGTLLLRSRDQLDEQGHAGVLVEVCDSGAGLSPQALAQLFRPFFTTKNEGNGLGLWISVGLLERYGGSLSGANRRERGEDTPGAVFSIWLLCDPVDQKVGGHSD